MKNNKIIYQAKTKILDLNMLLNIICNIANLTTNEIKSNNKRNSTIVAARYIFSYIAYSYGYSMPDVAKNINIDTSNIYRNEADIAYRIETRKLYNDIYNNTINKINELNTSFYHNINE